MPLTLDVSHIKPPCRKTQETRKRVLGEEHPDTLTSIANLSLGKTKVVMLML